MESATIQIDQHRSVTVNTLKEGAVLLVEDQHGVAVVEMSTSEVDALVEALQRPFHG